MTSVAGSSEVAQRYIVAVGHRPLPGEAPASRYNQLLVAAPGQTAPVEPVVPGAQRKVGQSTLVLTPAYQGGRLQRPGGIKKVLVPGGKQPGGFEGLEACVFILKGCLVKEIGDREAGKELLTVPAAPKPSEGLKRTSRSLKASSSSSSKCSLSHPVRAL